MGKHKYLKHDDPIFRLAMQMMSNKQFRDNMMRLTHTINYGNFDYNTITKSELLNKYLFNEKTKVTMHVDEYHGNTVDINFFYYDEDTPYFCRLYFFTDYNYKEYDLMIKSVKRILK